MAKCKFRIQLLCLVFCRFLDNFLRENFKASVIFICQSNNTDVLSTSYLINSPNEAFLPCLSASLDGARTDESIFCVAQFSPNVVCVFFEMRLMLFKLRKTIKNSDLAPEGLPDSNS